MSDTAGSRNGSSDDASVDRLLLEAGLDDDGGLRPVLLKLQALAVEQPVPSDAVAALMMPAVTRTAVTAPALSRTVATRHLAVVPETGVVPAAAVVPELAEIVPVPDVDAPVIAPAAATGQLTVATDHLAARRRAKRRITLTSLSVAVSLAAGGAVAVASDQGIRDSIGQVNHAVTSFVSSVGGGPAPEPAETPARPGVPAVGPTEPAVTEPVPDAPGSGSGQATQPAPAPSGTAPAVPLPNLPLPENVTPGMPGGPLNDDGQPPGLPLPVPASVPLPGVHS